jgi:MSHA biogenesis protein MshO
MAGAPLRHASRPPGRVRGFSLVELIVVIVITGVIASVVGLFITGPIQGFLDQSRRAELVDAAQLAMTRMGRDVRAALPNSVRISGNALELLLTTDGDRYRAETPGSAADRLDFTADDASFNTLAPLGCADPDTPTGCAVTGALAIYPLSQNGANPYRTGDKVMSPFGNINIARVTNSGYAEYQVTLAAGHRFRYDSPTRRVYLVSGPVTWLCSPPQLLRYDGYGITDTQDVLPPGTPSVVAGNVQACSFQYAAGTAQRNAVVSIALSLADSAALTERVRLIRQIHVSNTP